MGDVWLHVDPPLLGRFAKFFKLENESKLKKGDQIINVTTLALGSRPKLGLAKVRANNEA